MSSALKIIERRKLPRRTSDASLPRPPSALSTSSSSPSSLPTLVKLAREVHVRVPHAVPSVTNLLTRLLLTAEDDPSVH